MPTLAGGVQQVGDGEGYLFRTLCFQISVICSGIRRVAACIRRFCLEPRFGIHRTHVAGRLHHRSIFLNDIATAFEAKDKPKHLLLAPYFKNEMQLLLSGWKHLVAQSMKEELPVPAFSSALNYFYSLVSAKLPANMIQAQRDYFGAHTFERTDELRGQFFHENWTGHGGDTKSGTYNV